MQAAGVKGYVLDAWFGHSAAVSAKHYLMVTDEDYATAVVPSQGNPRHPQPIKAQKNPGKTGVEMAA